MNAEATPAPASTPPPSAERAANGRFVKGNAGGPGNPFARQVAALRKAFLDMATPQDMAQIAIALIEGAKTGNVAAAKLVLSYTLGKPAPAVEPDQLNVEEWATLKAESGLMQELPQIMLAPDPELPLNMARILRPAMMNELGKRMHETFEAKEQKADAKEVRRKTRVRAAFADLPLPKGSNGDTCQESVLGDPAAPPSPIGGVERGMQAEFAGLVDRLAATLPSPIGANGDPREESAFAEANGPVTKR